MNALSHPAAKVERLVAFTEADLDDICDAADKAILDGNGFGWLNPPPRRVLENFWRGVLLMPQRDLFVARLDGTIVGSTQLLRPPPNNEAQGHSAQLTTFFIAPSARGHGLARGLLAAVEEAAVAQGYRLLDADVRATQTAAIQLLTGAGFKPWGEKQRYALVGGRYVSGIYFSKLLVPDQPGMLPEEGRTP